MLHKSKSFSHSHHLFAVLFPPKKEKQHKDHYVRLEINVLFFFFFFLSNWKTLIRCDFENTLDKMVSVLLDRV